MALCVLLHGCYVIPTIWAMGINVHDFLFFWGNTSLIEKDLTHPFSISLLMVISLPGSRQCTLWLGLQLLAFSQVSGPSSAMSACMVLESLSDLSLPQFPRLENKNKLIQKVVKIKWKYGACLVLGLVQGLRGELESGPLSILIADYSLLRSPPG